MSAPTPQEIRDRLAKVEITLAHIHEEITETGIADAHTLTSLLDVKTHVLHTTALTLLAEQQQVANRLAAAQILATTNSGYATRDATLIAREVLENSSG